jgi:predicted Zn-ribbon and HTH transcriptional regulator
LALVLYKPKARPTHPMKGAELHLERVRFNIHKFNNRPRQGREKTLIISCFSEFGCEIVGCMYCIPRLLKRFPGRYIIAMGWHGRAYLYRHLVDEFWEINEENMWLRDYCYAFHHMSDNLKRIEKGAAHKGAVIPSSMLGRFAIGNCCRTCGKYWNEWRRGATECPQCKSTVITSSIFGDPGEYKQTAVRIPQPSSSVMAWAKKLVEPNTVGVFARGRKTYGRNLPPEFYVKLIEKLEGRGHKVIWLGEKQSTQACPVPHVLDFSRDDQSRDLEKTLAIISCLKYTIQFWTASSRLAGMMGIPYILFESPEQIYCSGFNPGQEGRRLELTTFGPKKVVLSHYLNVLNDQEKALGLVDRAVDELEAGNYEDMIGMVEEESSTELLKTSYYDM